MAKAGSPRPGRRGSKEFWKVYGPATLATLAGFVLAYQFVEPAPPRSFVLATGQKEGAYYSFAERYREILAREGVTGERPAGRSVVRCPMVFHASPPRPRVRQAAAGAARRACVRPRRRPSTSHRAASGTASSAMATRPRPRPVARPQ